MSGLGSRACCAPDSMVVTHVRLGSQHPVPKHRQVRSLFHSHTAGKWISWILNPGLDPQTQSHMVKDLWGLMP